MPRSTLSELAHCVLAVIYRRQPCTAYAVRREFQTSQTASWRASTGSIYPLLKKLASSRHILRTEVSGSARRAKMLTLTKTGEAAVRAWLTTVSDDLAAPVADPIRTRAHLMSSLSPDQALDLVHDWHRATARALAAVEERFANATQNADEVGMTTLRGTELQLKARLQWLDELISARADSA